MTLLRLDISILRMPQGGYVVTAGSGDGEAPVQAVSTLSELRCALGDMALDHFEPPGEPMTMPRVASESDQTVIRRPFWQRLLRAEAA